MKKKLYIVDNERLDVPDALAIHGLADDALRYLVRALVAGESEGAVVVRGFTCTVNPTDDSQVLVDPGVAIVAELSGATSSFGQVTADDSDQKIAEFTGLLANTYGLWVKFVYVLGEQDNRARWRTDLAPPREQVFQTMTRSVADWQVQVSVASPGAGWMRVATVVWDGGLVDADVADARTLFFEGAGSGGDNPAGTWTIPAFSRDTDRSTNGVRTLRGFAMAVLKRLEELGGRRWFTLPPFGENVRSASAEILISADTALASSVHYVLPADTEERQAALALYLSVPNLTNQSTDPRSVVRFVPATGGSIEAISVSTANNPILISGASWPKRIEGPVQLRRTAGANDLLRVNDWYGLIHGVTFKATSGNAELVRISGAAVVTFEDCIFDGTSVGTITRLVRVSSTAAVRFVRCSFLATGATTVGALLDIADADVRFEGCTFSAGAFGIQATEIPKLLLVSGGRFAGVDVGIQTPSQAGLVVIGPEFATTTTTCIDCGASGLVVPAAQESVIALGVASTGIGAFRLLGARDGAVYFDGTTGTTKIAKTGTGATTLFRFHRPGADADVQASRLYASSGFVGFEARSDANDGARLSFASHILRLLDATAVGDANSVQPVFNSKTLCLGGSTANPLAYATRNTLVKAWGVIRRFDNVAFSADVWRAARGNYGELVVTNPDPFGDGTHVYKVTGLALPDALYGIQVTVARKDQPALLGLEALGAEVWGKTADEFFMMPTRADSGGVDIFAGGGFDDYEITWSVHAICEVGTAEYSGGQS